MKIGDLAKRAGCGVETVRYYEREGLLSPPARSEGNYRVYCEADVERLTFIRNCRALDMTHDEIRALLRFKDCGGQDCGDINALLDEHIGHVARRIAELQGLEAQLQALRASCGQRRPIDECGILRGLGEPTTNHENAGAHHAAHLRGTHGGGCSPAALRGFLPTCGALLSPP